MLIAGQLAFACNAIVYVSWNNEQALVPQVVRAQPFVSCPRTVALEHYDPAD